MMEAHMDMMFLCTSIIFSPYQQILIKQISNDNIKL
jgi:hypothetical protein